MTRLLAQFGTIRNPFVNLAPGTGLGASSSGSGLVIILGNLVRLLIVVAGVYTLWNIIMAGYGFLSASGEPKNIAKAWEKIWQSILGLVIVAGSFILAAIFGYLIFNDPMFLISPKIY
jgi:hypothetical protein